MITSLYAAILAIILITLSILTIKARRVAKVSIGNSDDDNLQRKIRAHGNFVEYSPIFIIILAIAESNSMHPYLIHFFGVIFLIGRILHAFGVIKMEVVKKKFIYRIAGMFCTFFCLGFLSLILLVQFLFV